MVGVELSQVHFVFILYLHQPAAVAHVYRPRLAQVLLPLDPRVLSVRHVLNFLLLSLGQLAVMVQQVDELDVDLFLYFAFVVHPSFDLFEVVGGHKKVCLEDGRGLLKLVL